jgi:hypothetical protein
LPIKPTLKNIAPKSAEGESDMKIPRVSLARVTFVRITSAQVRFARMPFVRVGLVCAALLLAACVSAKGASAGAAAAPVGQSNASDQQGNAANSADTAKKVEGGPTDASKPATFTGTIAADNGGQVVFHDSQANKDYHLDDSKTAAKFAGKQVVITGKLNPSTNVIHVVKIKKAS